MNTKSGQTGPPASLVLAPQRAAGEPYTTSEIIAAGAGVQRRTVDHLLLTHKADFEEFGILRFEIAKTGGRGRPEIIYHLNEQQATLLMTYLKNTEVVRAFKKELVRQFYAMRSLLLERASPVWQDARSLGKEIRRQETEAIKRLVDYAVAQGSRKAGWYYANLSKLADATVGIVERDKAQVVQLTALLLVEQTIAQEIAAGIEARAPYWEIYRAVKDRLAGFPAVGALAGGR
ncbi:MAG: Rha family transcriptional regulator [Oscillospiraceae bacterium]|nr:Rha family transcriptional regulator [Oscillospiraceae bacterium]